MNIRTFTGGKRSGLFESVGRFRLSAVVMDVDASVVTDEDGALCMRVCDTAHSAVPDFELCSREAFQVSEDTALSAASDAERELSQHQLSAELRAVSGIADGSGAADHSGAADGSSIAEHSGIVDRSGTADRSSMTDRLRADKASLAHSNLLSLTPREIELIATLEARDVKLILVTSADRKVAERFSAEIGLSLQILSDQDDTAEPWPVMPTTRSPIGSAALWRTTAARRAERVAAQCSEWGMNVGSLAAIATHPADGAYLAEAGLSLALPEAGGDACYMADAVMEPRASGGLVQALERLACFAPQF